MTKQQALNHLNHKRSHFLDQGKFGRADTMKKFIDDIESEQITNYDDIETVGLELELRPYTQTIIHG